MRKPTIPLYLALYLMSCGLFATYLFFDTLTNNFNFLGSIFPDIVLKLENSTLVTISFMFTGSLYGAIILSLKGLHKYAAMKRKFETSYIGSYIIGPWAAAFFGIVMYGIIRGGLFIFGGIGSIDTISEATEFGYFGIGFIVGFAWDKTLDKLDALANEILGQMKTPKQKDEDDSDKIE